MITPRKRTVSVVRHEYAIPSPATQRDLTDTLVQASHEMEAAGLHAHADDSLHVMSYDEALVVYWTEEVPE